MFNRFDALQEAHVSVMMTKEVGAYGKINASVIARRLKI
jgi:hypothetical protein